MLKLFNELNRCLLKDRITKKEFAQYILNDSYANFKNLFYLNGLKNEFNVVYVNAIKKWLSDKDRLTKFWQAKKNGKFYYLDAKNIDKDVLKLFGI